MQVHFIINPFAGSGRGMKRWQQFKQQLTKDYAAHFSHYAGHALLIAGELAAQATAENPVCIVAIGGDGTIHEVVNGVGHVPNVYIGAVSAGSGNDFGRGYAVFDNGGQLEQFLLHGNSSVHDVGVAKIAGKSICFVNNFGVGFDALVALTANESKLKKRLNKWKLGKLSYPYFVVAALFTYKPYKLAIVQNGREQQYEKVWFATVSNQPYFGGGMNLSPHSDTTDGLLEVTIVANLSKWKLLFLFVSVFFAQHTRLKEVHQFKTQQIELKFTEPVPAHADGEKQALAATDNQIHIAVRKKAWHLAK